MQSASSWSPDGRVIAFTQISLETGPDVWVLPIDERKPRVFAQTKFAEGSPKFSPDGRWIAYASNESGRNEIYVQAYPGPGPKVQVSAEGGTDPVWRGKGGELYYRNGDYLMAVAVSTHGNFTASKPRVLWQGLRRHPRRTALPHDQRGRIGARPNPCRAELDRGAETPNAIEKQLIYLKRPLKFSERWLFQSKVKIKTCQLFSAWLLPSFARSSQTIMPGSARCDDPLSLPAPAGDI